MVGQWITHVIWSDWVTTGTDAIECRLADCSAAVFQLIVLPPASNELALACEDGSVHTIKVQLQFAGNGQHSSLNLGEPVMRIPPNASAITGLQFAHVSHVPELRKVSIASDLHYLSAGPSRLHAHRGRAGGDSGQVLLGRDPTLQDWKLAELFPLLAMQWWVQPLLWRSYG